MSQPVTETITHVNRPVGALYSVSSTITARVCRSSQSPAFNSSSCSSTEDLKEQAEKEKSTQDEMHLRMIDTWYFRQDRFPTI